MIKATFAAGVGISMQVEGVWDEKLLWRYSARPCKHGFSG